MKKVLKRISLMFTVLLMTLSITTGNVFASSSIQDGLKVSTTTDKESYQKDDKAITTIFIKNTNGYNMEDIKVTVSLPKELSSKDQQSFDIPLLKAGESKEYKVTIEKDQVKVTVTPDQDKPTSNVDKTSQSEDVKVDVKTDDNTPIIGWTVLIGISGLAIVLLRKNHKGKQFIILALISTMTLSGLTMGSVHAESSMLEKKMSLTQKLVFDNQSYNMDIDITYFIPNGEVVTEGEVTREEWITKLVDLYDYTYITNTTTYSFSDYKEAKDPFKIETAIQYSIIDIKANEEFRPNEYATREFVSYTTIQALNLFNTSKGSLDCTDKDILKYPDEDYLMVKHGMLKLVDNQFKPNQYISNDEVTQVINGINRINDLAMVDESVENQVDYRDNVKMINANYESVSENSILLDNNTLQNGEIVLIENDVGDIAIKVEKVQKQGNKTLVQYSTPEVSDILKSIHLEGKTDYTEAFFVPEEGVTVGNASSKARKVPHDAIPLEKEFPIHEDIGDVSVDFTLCLEEVEYCFDIDWLDEGNILPYVNEAYCALNIDSDLNVSYTGSDDLIERDDPLDILEKVGRAYVPLGASGFLLAFDINLVATIEGKIELNVNLDSTMGFQCIDNDMKLISDHYPDLDTDKNDFVVSAQARFGIKPEVALVFGVLPTVDIANTELECGIGIDGSTKNQLIKPYQYCIDGKTYFYATASASMFPDISAISKYLTIEKELFNSSNSPLKLQFHFEESGIVEKCTRGLVSYQGIVKDAQTDQVIANAKVQIYDETNNIIDELYTNESGDFISQKLKSGTYTLIVSAMGYETYRKTVEVSSGEDIFVEIYLTQADEDVDTETFTLEIGKTYRIKCTSDKKLYSLYHKDSSAELYYSNSGQTGCTLNDKGFQNTYSYRPMEEGDFIDIKLNSGNVELFVVKDDDNIKENRENIHNYFIISELDHDPLKKFNLSQGNTISLDYQYIDNRLTNVKYYFEGINISGTMTEIDYYWNDRFGWEIKEEEKDLNSTEKYWTVIEEGSMHKYQINSGSVILYMGYDDSSKLIIN